MSQMLLQSQALGNLFTYAVQTQGHRSDRVCCAPQMGFDGPLSAQEQMFILYEVKMQCFQNLSNMEPTITGTHCSANFKEINRFLSVYIKEKL